MTRPITTAKTNGQYEPLPPFFDDVPGALLVVVSATGRVSISGSLAPSCDLPAAALVLARFFAARFFACAARFARDPAAATAGGVAPAVDPALAAFTVRAFWRGAAGNGYGLASRPFSAPGRTPTRRSALGRG